MNMTGTCQGCGQPITGIVRQHRPGAPWRESWSHIESPAEVHTAHPADGTVGPAMDADFVFYPDVTVKLIGEDGNAWHLIGLTSRALREQVGKEQAARFQDLALDTQSYDELLALIQHTVKVS